jgi:hypothetical protein
MIWRTLQIRETCKQLPSDVVGDLCLFVWRAQIIFGNTR